MSSIANFFRETVHVLGAVLRPTGRSLRDNTGLAALSVVLAFGVWVVVTQADNPTRSRIVDQNIPVEPVNIPASVAVVEPVQSVRVRVTVADDDFAELSAADFRATVNLEGLTVGSYERPVDVTALDPPRGLRIEEVIAVDSPTASDKIRITLAPLRTKTVPVFVDVQGSPASGYSMGAPETEDLEVLVSGPIDKVDQVSTVRASITVEGRTDDVDQSIHLSPRAELGELVQGVKLSPDITGLQIDIIQEKFSRSVAVSPQLIGAPDSGYNVSSVSVSPPTVTVSGPQELINSLTTIPTKSIDLDDAAADVVKGVSLDLPPGTEVAGGPSVTVTVRIAPIEGNFTFAVPVTATGLGEDVTIAGALPTVTVTLFGPLPLLQGLGPNDIPATVDLAGDEQGVHRKQVKLTPPGGATVRAVNPPEITVTLEQR
jgi:YbbR domain-containing protein